MAGNGRPFSRRTNPVRAHHLLLLGVIAAASLVLVSSAGASGGAAFSFTDGVDPRPVVTAPGETFLKSFFTIPYAGGPVILAGDHSGTANLRVGDVLSIKIVHPDGTTAKYIHDFTNKCRAPITAIPPVDISSSFAVGNNVVSAYLKDACGGNESSNAIWILP